MQKVKITTINLSWNSGSLLKRSAATAAPEEIPARIPSSAIKRPGGRNCRIAIYRLMRSINDKSSFRNEARTDTLEFCGPGFTS